MNNYQVCVADLELRQLLTDNHHHPLIEIVGKELPLTMPVIQYSYANLPDETRGVIIDAADLELKRCGSNSQIYATITDVLAEQLLLRFSVNEWWNDQSHLMARLRFRKFIRNILLHETVGKIVIYLQDFDEERLFAREFIDFLNTVKFNSDRLTFVLAVTTEQEKRLTGATTVILPECGS